MLAELFGTGSSLFNLVVLVVGGGGCVWWGFCLLLIGVVVENSRC